MLLMGIGRTVILGKKQIPSKSKCISNNNDPYNLLTVTDTLWTLKRGQIYSLLIHICKNM